MASHQQRRTCTALDAAPASLTEEGEGVAAAAASMMYGGGGAGLFTPEIAANRQQHQQLQPHQQLLQMPCCCGPVYEITAGQPAWCKLYRLAAERTAHLASDAIVRAIKARGRGTPTCEHRLTALKNYLNHELPTDVTRDVLDICLARDRFRCHHNPSDCLALELWRVFFDHNFTDVSIHHHEFGFPKTTNYPDIVQNLELLFELVSRGPRLKRLQQQQQRQLQLQQLPQPPRNSQEQPPHLASQGQLPYTGRLRHQTSFSSTTQEQLQQLRDDDEDEQLARSSDTAQNSVTSFRLELKHCEMGCFLQDKVIDCVSLLAHNLRVLEIPGLGSDELLYVIAKDCTNLEVLNVKGSREQVSDRGFVGFVDSMTAAAKAKLWQLDVTRCMLSQLILATGHLGQLTGLRDLRISTRVLDEISVGVGVSQGGVSGDLGTVSASAVMPAVTSVTVEHDNIVQVSVNQVLVFLRHLFPYARHVALRNCIACELHVTMTQQPSNITYLRQHIHTLELISADYFNFPPLVYPCPNLEALHIEKPTNDVFNVEQQMNAPMEDMNNRRQMNAPFENLKVLRLSRISLTNLTQFLSRLNHLKSFKVTNIGRRERPRWTDQRIRQILPVGSVPLLEDFHVSCLPNEGLSTVENHRYLHLTKETVRYLTENFRHLKRIAGIETWNPRNCQRESLNLVLSSDKMAGKFHLTS